MPSWTKRSPISARSSRSIRNPAALTPILAWSTCAASSGTRRWKSAESRAPDATGSQESGSTSGSPITARMNSSKLFLHLNRWSAISLTPCSPVIFWAVLFLCRALGRRHEDAGAAVGAGIRQFPYLYVLSNAAHRAGRKELDDGLPRSSSKLGDGSPEYHLFLGKYHLNLDQYDRRLGEFQAPPSRSQVAVRAFQSWIRVLEEAGL